MFKKLKRKNKLRKHKKKLGFKDVGDEYRGKSKPDSKPKTEVIYYSTKIIFDIINTIITVMVGIFLMGLFGIVIAFIPDIMLIFIISDLWQKEPRDKLTGVKLDIHLMLHSVTFICILIIVLIITMFLSLFLFSFMWRVVVVLIVHVFIDQLTHSEKYGGHFTGYGRRKSGKNE